MANRAERTLGYELRRLHAPVREKVVEKWAESQCQDEWWEWTFKDAKRMGALMGITVEDIYFSGFWSQGDGASFTGRYACKPDAVQAITRECGGSDKELIRIASELSVLQTTLKLQHGFTFECTIARDRYSNYSHSGTINVDVWGTKENVDEDIVDDAAAEYVEPTLSLMRAFADWIYRQLEAEHEYLTSEKAVTESIESSGLRFTADGEILRSAL